MQSHLLAELIRSTGWFEESTRGSRSMSSKDGFAAWMCASSWRLGLAITFVPACRASPRSCPDCTIIVRTV